MENTLDLTTKNTPQEDNNKKSSVIDSDLRKTRWPADKSQWTMPLGQFGVHST